MKALSYRTETVIHRPPEDVFDFCSDLRSELQWNPKAKYVEKLTDGPVSVGTRYQARWSNSGPTAVEVITLIPSRQAANVPPTRPAGDRRSRHRCLAIAKRLGHAARRPRS